MPVSNGGFSILGYKIYVNNGVVATVDPTDYTYQIAGLTLGTTYKI